MTSDLSIFTERLRDFISICAGEPEFGVPPSGGSSNDTALRTHCDAEFNGMALVLYALQFSNNPAGRRFCEARKAPPDSITHWTQIPAMPASAFKEFELSCLPAAERTAVFHSSGTTAHRPSRHFHSAESLAVYDASLLPWFRANVLPDLTPDAAHLTLLTPPPAQAPHSSLVHMFDVVRRKLAAPESAFAGGVSRDGAWVLDPAKARSQLRESVNGNRPLILLGTAFSFVHLLDDLAEHELNFALPPGSRVLETGGYKGRSRSLPKAELHALITRRLGIPASHIVCEYGMSELSSQAYDQQVHASRITHHASRAFHFPPWARAQVVSPETGREVADGETGLIRVFDLANVFSVMAIQTEDLAVRRGDGFELLGRTESAEPRGCSLLPQPAIGNRQSAVS